MVLRQVEATLMERSLLGLGCFRSGLGAADSDNTGGTPCRGHAQSHLTAIALIAKAVRVADSGRAPGLGQSFWPHSLVLRPRRALDLARPPHCRETQPLRSSRWVV